ncbi:class I SAM-dependent methyltransferase [Roseibium sp.]|uniref:class I SAM-dependent methyltransferase n=1 Tax=Roseibium sp. TaxID=1936156 RepID=UPI003BB0C4CB
MNEFSRVPEQGSFSRALTFGREWVRAPLRVGAVSPSGPALAKAITKGISATSSPVIELGPGTGVFTAALRERGVSDDKIALIEASAPFANTLATRFPNIKVLNADASRIHHVSPFGKTGTGTIVCGLPLLSMPSAKVYRIVRGSFATLRTDGTIRLFSYTPICPVPTGILDHLGVAVHRESFVAANLPPAFVFTLAKE